MIGGKMIMQAKTQLAEQIEDAERKEDILKYDNYAKKILSHKMILAYILQRVVKEQKGMSIPEIVSCFERDVKVGTEALMSDFIRGENLEDWRYGEGRIFYDLRLSLANIEGHLKLFVDVEAQKNFWPGYSLPTRGIVYGARMISSQIETEFPLPDYGELKKVYSIWICFDPPKRVGNAISVYSMKKEDLLGHIPCEETAYDKLSVVQICLDDSSPDQGDRMIRLLNTIFSGNYTSKEVEETLEDEYNIPMSRAFKEEVGIMCNLGERIAENATKKGMQKGIQQGIIQSVKKLLENGIPSDEVKRLLKVTDEEIRLAKK